MELTSALIYSIRFCSRLELPKGICANIAKLRTVPATYRPVRAKVKYVAKNREDADNWREKILRDCIRRVRETLDPEYDEMFGIFNKITASNMDILANNAIKILAARDKEFRMRVTTLLFDKAIRGSAFAGVMADLANKLNVANPEISEDLEVHVKMFTTLYDMAETLTFPQLSDSEFDDKVIAWSKQKDVRRGYARFLTHLYSRSLVSGEALQTSMQRVIADLNDTIIQPKSPQSEENATQFTDFIFEIAKLLKPSAIELRGLILTSGEKVLKQPRDDFPSLNMRSRFKLEDTVKCVKVC